MKEIPLTRGKAAFVDDADFPLLNSWKWHYMSVGYAKSTQRDREILMHRFLLNAPPGTIVDHINGNGLDNRRANLRLCDKAQNAWNSPFSGSSASFDAQRKQWKARIRHYRQEIFLGRFATEEDARVASETAALFLRGDFLSC